MDLTNVRFASDSQRVVSRIFRPGRRRARTRFSIQSAIVWNSAAGSPGAAVLEPRAPLLAHADPLDLVAVERRLDKRPAGQAIGVSLQSAP